MSNLAWAAGVEDRAFTMLGRHGFGGIEVAPTRIADWDGLTDRRLADYRRGCADAGLVVSSLQAILFNRPEAHLLGEPPAFDRLCEHMRRVGGVAAALGAGVAVFGSPRNRLRGAMDLDAAVALGAERLRRIGDIVADAGLVIGLEPVPPYYGGDFMTRIAEVAAVVERCDHPAIRAHIDCACIMLGGDDAAAAIRTHGGLMAHYHAAEPDLGPFAAPLSDHPGAARALGEVAYDGWVVIEMRQQGEDGLEGMSTALDYVGRVYGGPGDGAARPA